MLDVLQVHNTLRQHRLVNAVAEVLSSKPEDRVCMLCCISVALVYSGGSEQEEDTAAALKMLVDHDVTGSVADLMQSTALTGQARTANLATGQFTW